MNRKRFTNWPSRLILLSVLLASLLVLRPQESAKASGDYSCSQLYSFCVYSCAVQANGNLDVYDACRIANCETMYLSCESCAISGQPADCEGGYEIPEPYPGVADYTMCMDNCAACSFLPLAERSACFVPCKTNCIALYGN